MTIRAVFVEAREAHSRRCFVSVRVRRGRSRCSSFLADSPRNPGLVVQACAERVAPEIGEVAWVVDDTGIVKDGEHSPGGEAAVPGDSRQDR